MTSMLRQSTAVTVKMGLFLDEDDGKTAEPALVIDDADVRLSKNNGAYDAAAGPQDSPGADHDEGGEYDINLGVDDTDTVGRLKVRIHVAGALPVWQEFQVLEEAIYDAFYAADADGTLSGTAVATRVEMDSNSVLLAAIVLDTGTTLPASIATIDGNVDLILGDTGTDIPALIAALNDLDAAGVRAAIGLASANLDTQLGTIDGVADAVKLQTDKLTFTVAGNLDCNVQRINDVAVTGDGAGTPFGV